MRHTARLVMAMACLLSLAGMSGCSTPLSRLHDYNGADAGNLLFSLGEPGAPPASQIPTLSGKKLGTDDLIELTYASSWGKVAPLDIPFAGGTGMVIARKLPPGEYEIGKIDISVSDDVFTVSNALPVPIRFTIQSGQTTYIGRYSTYVDLGNPEEPSQPGAVTVIPIASMRAVADISDEQAIDMVSARNKYPYLKTGTVTSFVPLQGK